MLTDAETVEQILAVVQPHPQRRVAARTVPRAPSVRVRDDWPHVERRAGDPEDAGRQPKATRCAALGRAVEQACVGAGLRLSWLRVGLYGAFRERRVTI